MPPRLLWVLDYQQQLHYTSDSSQWGVWIKKHFLLLTVQPVNLLYKFYSFAEKQSKKPLENQTYVTTRKLNDKQINRKILTCISRSLKCACFLLLERLADSLFDNILQSNAYQFSCKVKWCDIQAPTMQYLVHQKVKTGENYMIDTYIFISR